MTFRIYSTALPKDIKAEFRKLGLDATFKDDRQQSCYDITLKPLFSPVKLASIQTLIFFGSCFFPDPWPGKVFLTLCLFWSILGFARMFINGR